MTKHVQISSHGEYFRLEIEGDFLTKIDWLFGAKKNGEQADSGVSKAANHPLAAHFVSQMDDYFSGKLHRFDLPLKFVEKTFSGQVLGALAKIPFGRVASYSQVAEMVGRPKAIRAIGTACRKNPFPIVVPCHRIVRTNGHLSGYYWGLARKVRLLEHEGLNINGDKVIVPQTAKAF